MGAFSVGAAFGERAGETPRERVVAFLPRNPPLYAAALALIAPDALAPEVLVDASRIAIVAMLPLGFFAVGAALAEEAEEGRSRFRRPSTPRSRRRWRCGWWSRRGCSSCSPCR